jgi:hypothetical protein
MLTIPGPPPITPVQRSEESNLFLRVNQKVAGEVLQVANDQVILSIQGVQVVAKLTTPDQMAELIDRRFAQFIVKEFNPTTVLLQLVEPDAGGANPAPAAVLPQQEAEFLGGLLKQIGINPDAGSKLIAEQLIRQGLPVSPENIQELQTALQSLGKWTETDVQQAVQLKSYGIPLTPETIQLMSKGPAEVTQTLNSLVKQLETLSQQGSLPAPVKEQVNTAIRILSQGILQGDQPAPRLIEGLKNSITLLGKTIEHELLQSAIKPGTELEQGLMALSRLRSELSSRGYASIAGDIDRLNDYLRLVHLPNAEPNDPKIQNQWFRMEIPVHFPAQPGTQADESHPAHIRVAREQNKDGGSSVDPRYTRMVIQVDLGLNQTIEVDLSVVNRQVGLAITTSDDSVKMAAMDELDGLKGDLDQLGYTTRFSHVETGEMQSSPEATQIPNLSLLHGNINLEV